MRIVFICVVFLFTSFSSIVFSEDAWTHITEINGQGIGYVCSIASEEDGTIWIYCGGGVGVYKSFVYKYKDNIWTDESSHFEGLSNGTVTVSPNGDVWFGFYPSTLVKFDGQNWYYYSYGANFGFSNICVDSNNTVWGSSASNAGLVKFDGTTWKIFAVADGLIRSTVSRVKVSPADDIWLRYGKVFGTYKISGIYPTYFGVSRFNGTEWITYDEDDGLRSNHVDDIAFGPDGEVYISYGGFHGDPLIGISRFDGSAWELLSDSINGIIEYDRNGTLWILDNDHRSLYKYNGVSFEKCPDKPSEILARYTRTITFDADNNVWLGLSTGILKFDTMAESHIHNEVNPQDFVLYNNYPNPFNAYTVLTFDLSESSHINLGIYNTNGQKVVTLIDAYYNIGLHSIVFNAHGLPSGFYAARLESNSFIETKRMLLIK